MSKTKKILTGIFLIVIVAMLIKYISATDFTVMLDYMAQAPSLIPLLILVSFLGHFTGTVAWKLVLREESDKVSLSELFFFRLICENLTIFNPTTIIAGDGLKGVFLSKKKISPDVNMASVLLSRVLLIVTAILLVVASIVYLVVSTTGLHIPTLAVPLLVIVSVVVMVGLLYLLLHKNLYLYKLVKRLQQTYLRRWLSDEMLAQIAAINKSLCDFYRGSKWRLTGAFVLSLLHWVCGALEFYLILKFFGMPVSLIDAVVIEMGVIGFKAAGSMIPGQIGVEEYGNKVMLNIAGIVGNEIWLIVSLLRRGRQMFWLLVTAPASIVIYKRYKVQVGR